ncbi:DUF6153 family protein [Streptomyces sp. NPDC048603]|uniref:DUF6153 family protein n=1 Tax=Streptomyces sp. NPDC048603 TaxID=3365577 RepID=UPI00372009F9
MIAAVQPSSRRNAGYGLALLVLAVLAGVLGMHGLAPGAAFATSPKAAAAAGHGTTSGHGTGGHATTGTAGHRATDGGIGIHRTAGSAATVRHEAAAGDCSHTAGGTGHANGHADAMCTAAGVATPYVPPAPAPALTTEPAPALFPSGAAGSPASGRAPPDLAELQLLRI